MGVLCYLLFVIGLAIPAPAAVRLTLRVEPAEQLPGIPSTFHVQATNGTTSPLRVPKKVALQVVPTTGDPFVSLTVFRGEERVAEFPGSEKGDIILQPGEKRDVTFWATLESPPWFFDKRFYVPGTYRLQIVADDELHSGRLGSVNRVLDQEGLNDPAVSNEVTLTVKQPTGDDGAVFELIRNLRNPTFWSDELDSVIWHQYPSSTYAIYAVPDVSPRDYAQEIRDLEVAIQREPNALISDLNRLIVARNLLRVMGVHKERRELEEAVGASDRARAILEELIKRARDPNVRENATTALRRDVLTRKEIEDGIKVLAGEMTELQPHLSCVAITLNGRYVFWFSYQNATDEEKEIPIGPRNKFTPPPFDRGQPTRFRRHQSVLAFKVESGGPELTWHIDNQVIRMSKDTDQCPSDLEQNLEKYRAGELP